VGVPKARPGGELGDERVPVIDVAGPVQDLQRNVATRQTVERTKDRSLAAAAERLDEQEARVEHR
jgi:hypothetical protein